MHWAFELNKEFCTLYLLHHILGLVYLISREKFKERKGLSGIFAVLVVQYLAVLLGPISFEHKNDFTNPAQIQVDYKSQSEPIILSNNLKFDPLPDLSPGSGVIVGKLSGLEKTLTLVVLDVDYPWTAEGIYRRKVILKRLNNLFRHENALLDGPTIIIGEVSTGPYTWDYKQFFKEGMFRPLPLTLSMRLGLAFIEHPVAYFRDLRIMSYRRSGSSVTLEVSF